MAALVRDRSELRDPAIVGSKFARQAELRDAGFPIPDFLCLPVSAFDEALARVRPALPPVSSTAGLEALLGWAARARSLLETGEPPADLADPVLAAFDEIAGPDGVVAVRACAVRGPDGAAEDGAGDPFAGLSSSHLCVRRTEVLSCVAECWASAFSPHGVRYRLRRGLDPTVVRVAVGIQRMAPGTRSFVAFSRDPRDGGDRCVIAAAHGNGEGVVQEKADIDHFFVDSTTGAVARTVVRKQRMIVRSEHGGVGEAPVPTELSAQPVLDDVEARRVAALTRRVHAHFGAPQDVEGTVTPDGTIHLLQARPVPIPPASPASSLIDWSSANITESFPGVSCALTYSLALEFYRRSFGDLYRRLGVRRAVLRREQPALGRMVGLIDGRIHYRLDSWYRLHGRIPGFAFVREIWEQQVGAPASTGPTDDRLAGLRLVLALPRLVLLLLTFPASVRRFLRWWDGVVERAVDLDDRPADELADLYRTLWDQVAVRWGVTLVNSFFAMATIRLLQPLLRRWARDDDRSLFVRLLSGGPENRSLAGLRSGLALAERIDAHPALRTDLLGREGQEPRDIREVWDGLVGGCYGDDLADAARLHVRRYGDRAPQDLKLEEPTPREQPWMALAMIRPFVAQRLTVASSRATEAAARQAAERELRVRCPSPLRRCVLRLLLDGLRWFARVREDTRLCRSQLFGLTRHLLWRLGDVLAEHDRLDEGTDVVDLTVQEVTGAFEGTLAGSDLRGLVQHRRAERALFEARPGRPPLVRTRGGVPLAAALPWSASDRGQSVEPATLLRGLASSSGVARGQATVVLDPTVPAESCENRILVARETDPGWLFLMLVARGIVVERGTLLSHSAITGRLLGIPTVVGVSGATALIRDGEWIEVDGGAGTVRLMADRVGA